MKPRQPKFSWQKDIEEVANMINLPHEDYPHRVRRTEEVIESLIRAGVDKIDSTLCRMIHAYIFSDQPFAGKWREVDVMVGDFTPMGHHLVKNAIEGIFPVSSGLLDWYKTFETIHPFQDGNGRVGGVILAVLSRWNGYYLTPDDKHGVLYPKRPDA